MYGNTTTADVRQAMQTLREAGIATVKIEFSGGNDEGGADSMDAFDAAGNEIALPKSRDAYLNQDWNHETKTYGPKYWSVSEMTGDGKWGTRPATDDEVKWATLRDVLEHPIYDRYGSFAGEFYCHGTVEWDVAAGTHKMSGSESHEVWENF